MDPEIILAARRARAQAMARWMAVFAQAVMAYLGSRSLERAKTRT